MKPQTTASPQPLELHLLNHFELLGDEGPILLPQGSQRLIAFLALRGGSLRRAHVAGTLWPKAGEEHALASLRSELWRAQSRAPGAVEVGWGNLQLSRSVSVDLHESRQLAYRLLDPTALLRSGELAGPSVPMLAGELLPDWYEEWVFVEGEHWRQLRLHALENLSARLRDRGSHEHAVEAALAAVRGDPLRESAQAALILAHLAEGNQSEAIRAFERYRTRLREELGLEPTPRLNRLVSERIEVRIG